MIYIAPSGYLISADPRIIADHLICSCSVEVNLSSAVAVSS